MSLPTAALYGGRIGTVQTPVSFSAAGKPEGIVLTWSIAAGSSNPAGIIIYRSLSGSGTFNCIDTATGTSYCDTAIESRQYYYRIAAYNSLGTSELTPIVNVGPSLP